MLGDIKVRPVLNGWIVEVGCQELVFPNMDTMLGEIKNYLRDPDATEKWYGKFAVNAKYFRFDGIEVETDETTEGRTFPGLEALVTTNLDMIKECDLAQ